MKKFILGLVFAITFLGPSAAMAQGPVGVTPVLAAAGADGGELEDRTKAIVKTAITILKWIAGMYVAVAIIIMLRGEGNRHVVIAFAGFALIWSIDLVATALGGEVSE